MGNVNSNLKKLVILAAGIFIIAAIFAGYKRKTHDIIISSTPSFYHFAQRSAEIYEKNNKKSALVESDSSDSVKTKLNLGLADIGFIVEKKEIRDFEKYKVALSPVVFAVHPSNPANNLSKKDIVDIYTSKITLWKKLSSQNEPVLLFSKSYGDDLNKYFQEYSSLSSPDTDERGMESISENTHITNSDFETVGFISKLKGSIGYASLEAVKYLENKGIKVKVLSLDNIIPDKNSIKSKKYPMIAEYWLIYKKDNPKAAEYAAFIKSRESQNMLEEMHYISAAE